MYDDASGYYYLFVSYGGLTREGGYQIRQFRSKKVTGPYTDTEGNTFGYVTDHSAYGLKMMGNYRFPSLKTAYMAPGHCSAMRDEDGKFYLVYHQRFDSGSEYHEPRVHQMFINEDGWMVAAPFATAGESLEDARYQEISQIQGTYYCVNHGTDISSDIHDAAEMKIKKDGSIQFADGRKGNCNLSKESNYITLVIEDITYKGIIVDMQDEAGNAVRCIMAAGNNNESIWAVFYKE